MSEKQKILVAGGGGFIGGHLVGKLLSEGNEIVAADLKPMENWYLVHEDARNLVLNLEEKQACYEAAEGCDVIYNLGCNMGGMGFVEHNRALCMISVLINTHLLMAARDLDVKKYLFTSTACVYREDKQDSTDVVALKEEDAYPAMPEDGYGWEKLFSERMCRHFHEDFGIDVRVVRLHNVYGPYGTWQGGREKAPAAICRKVIEAKLSGNHTIEVWGDGEQRRSFMFIEDCLTGMEKIMASEHVDPINLGRDDMISINQLIDIVEGFAGLKLERQYNLDAPQGVRGRNSDNTKIREVLGWAPGIPIETGLRKTYDWIYGQMT